MLYLLTYPIGYNQNDKREESKDSLETVYQLNYMLNFKKKQAKVFLSH